MTAVCPVRATLAGMAALWMLGASPAAAADLEDGRKLYALRCVFCHGTDGKGDGPAGAALKPPPTDFTAPVYWKTARSETIRAVIENGKPSTAMVGFKAALRPEQIEDLVAYLTTLKPRP
jgi:high-affinity iron transporter